MTAGTIDREVTEAAALEGYVEITDEQAEEIGFLKVARRHERGWKDRKEGLTAKVKSFLGDAKGATHKGKVLAEVSTRGGQRKVDFDLLLAKYPEVYAEVVSKNDDSVIINIK